MLKFKKKGSAIHATHQIITNEINQFRFHFEIFINNKDPEALHQLRVSLRRLRCALGFLKKISPSPDLDELIQTAQKIGTLLGPIRELDVLKTLIISEILPKHKNQIEFKSLMTALDYLREEEFLKVMCNFDNMEELAYYDNINQYLLENKHTNSHIYLDNKNYSLSYFTKKLLRKLYKKSVKRNIDTLSNKEQHELRILLKKLRYASEFFGDFYDHKKTKRFIKAVCKLQDLLGFKNDLLTTMRLLSKIESFDQINISNSSQMVIAYNENIRTHLEVDILSAWNDFKKVQLYWL